MERDRNLEIKVGLFVMGGIALLVTAIVLLGSEQNLFERNYTLHGSFSDISGLREGAAVRLAGMDVGLVQAIEFPPDLDKKEVHVHMRLASRFQDRVRGDTLATIQTQGILGDKYIALDLGSADRGKLEDGAWLETRDPQDLMSGLDDIKQNVLEISIKINAMLGSDDGKGAGKSITGMLASLKNITAEIERGDGLIHQLIYDGKAGGDVRDMLTNIADATKKLDAVMGEIKSGDGTLHKLVYEDQISSLVANVDGLVTEVKEGDGTLHKLFYDDQISELVASLQKAVDGINVVITDVQEGDGMLNTLVYGEGTENLLANLTQASADIQVIIQEVKEGKGTLGALIVDPTVYEDVKTLLGGAKRNRIIKAYVRDTIRKNERGEGLSDGQ